MASGRLSVILISCLIAFSGNSLAQNKKKVEILQCDLLDVRPVVVNAQRLLGNVNIRVDGALMWCDSLYSYTTSNMVDAFGHVHIVRGDTLNMYADFINYNGDTKFAKARHNVKLIDKKVTLTTDSLDYAMITDLASYNYSGTIKDSTNVLNSVIGQYYVNEGKAYFKKKVDVVTKDYKIKSDTLIYYTNTKKVFLEGPTHIFNEKDTLYAEYGWYDSMKSYARLTKKPRMWNEKQTLKADSVFYDKVKGEGTAMGHARIQDIKNSIIVVGNLVKYNDLTKMAQATDSAMLIQYSKTDSLFLHADRLLAMPDTTVKDTTQNARLVLGYHKVRFFRDDIQGKCDSLAYWSKDSTIQFFTNPVIWSKMNQMSANYIEMINRSKDPDEIRMKEDAFIISMEEDSLRFNQIKGKNMTGYLRKNSLYRIDVNGNGQSNYYARDKKGLIGLNKAESSNIIIYMNEGKVKKISFIKSPDGELKPMADLDENDKLLPGFKWQEELRPKSKEDIFNDPQAGESPLPKQKTVPVIEKTKEPAPPK